MTDIVRVLGKPPETARCLVIDAPYWGYFRLLWLLMDAICAVLGDGPWALGVQARIYDPLCEWGIHRWMHWENPDD